MRFRLLDILFFVLAGIVMTAAFSNGGDRDNSEGILAFLVPGQSVSLKSEPGGYAVSFFDDEVELGYKVSAVGSNFVTFVDPAGTEISVPVYSIKSVSKLRRMPKLRLK